MRKHYSKYSINIFKYRYILILFLLFAFWIYIYAFKSIKVSSKNEHSRFIDYVIDLVSNTEVLRSDTGTKVLLYTNQNSNTVSLDFALPTGAFSDKTDKEGTMYILSKLLLRSPNVKEYIYKYSMKITIDLQRGFLFINITSANYYIKEIFELLKLILFSVKFDNEELTIVKKLVINELNDNSEDLNILFQDKILPNIFINNNYYKSIKGTHTSINNIKLEDIYYSYNNYLNFEDVILSISGLVNKNTINFYMNRMFVNLPKTNINISYRDEIKSNFIITSNFKEVKIPINNVENAIIYAVIPFIGAYKDIAYAKIISTFLGKTPNSYLSRAFSEMKDSIYNMDAYLYDDNFSKFWVILLEIPLNKVNLVEDKLRNLFNNSSFSYHDMQDSRNCLVSDNLKDLMSNFSISRYLTFLQIENNNLKSYIWNYDKYSFLDTEELKNLWNSNFQNPEILIIRVVNGFMK